MESFPPREERRGGERRGGEGRGGEVRGGEGRGGEVRGESCEVERGGRKVNGT